MSEYQRVKVSIEHGVALLVTSQGHFAFSARETHKGLAGFKDAWGVSSPFCGKGNHSSAIDEGRKVR